MSTIFAALWLADNVGSFLEGGGAAFYHSPIQPQGILMSAVALSLFNPAVPLSTVPPVMTEGDGDWAGSAVGPLFVMVSEVPPTKAPARGFGPIEKSQANIVCESDR